MNYTKKAIFGLLWVSVGTFLAQGLGYFLRLVLSRELTVSEYGAVYSIITLFALFGLIQTLGLGTALTTFIAKYSASNDQNRIRQSVKFVIIVVNVLSVFIGGIVFFFSNYLAKHYFGDESLSLLIKIFSIAFMLSGFEVLIQPIVQGFQKMNWSAGIDLLRASSLLIFTIIFIQLHHGVLSPLLAYIITYLLIALLGLFFLLRQIPHFFSANIEKKEVKPLMQYGFTMIVAGAGTIILNYTDTFFLTLFSTLEQVGYYQAALPTATLLKIPNALVAIVLLPIFAELWTKKQKKLIAQSMDEVRRYILICVLPFAISTIMFPETIMTLLFGYDFIQGAVILQILALSTIIYLFAGLNFLFFMGVGSPQKYSHILILGALLNIPLNLILIPSYGAIGVAVATLISTLVMFIYSEIQVRKIIKTHFSYKKYSLTLLSGVFFAFVLLLIRENIALINPYFLSIIAFIVGTLVYLIVLIITKSITIQEIKKLFLRTSQN